MADQMRRMTSSRPISGRSSMLASCVIRGLPMRWRRSFIGKLGSRKAKRAAWSSSVRRAAALPDVSTCASAKLSQASSLLSSNSSVRRASFSTSGQSPPDRAMWSEVRSQRVSVAMMTSRSSSRRSASAAGDVTSRFGSTGPTRQTRVRISSSDRGGRAKAAMSSVRSPSAIVVPAHTIGTPRRRRRWSRERRR